MKHEEKLKSQRDGLSMSGDDKMQASDVGERNQFSPANWDVIGVAELSLILQHWQASSLGILRPRCDRVKSNSLHPGEDATSPLSSALSWSEKMSICLAKFLLQPSSSQHPRRRWNTSKWRVSQRWQSNPLGGLVARQWRWICIDELTTLPDIDLAPSLPNPRNGHSKRKSKRAPSNNKHIHSCTCLRV